MSLLKMNQKFLSKSSWTLRGGGENNRSSANNNKTGRSVYMSPTSAVPINKLVIANGANSSKKKSQQQTTTTTTTPTSGSYHQLFAVRANGRAVDNNRNTTTTISVDHYSKASNEMKHSSMDVLDATAVPKQCNELVNNNSGHNLKLMRGMSHSITDLRAKPSTPARDHKSCEINNGETDELQLEIRERRIDMYIAEIEMEPVYQLGSTLRAIYDGDEHDRFMDKLNVRIKNHDKDIERMCNCHYQGFVECIHELLKVRPQAANLKNEICQIDDEVQKSSANIIRKAEEVAKYRRIVCNTQTAIEHLQKCLPMLETFSKLLAQMSEKKYYSALKTLELFETMYMPKIEKYRFAQSMRTKVPKIRETIKNESIRDLKDFLENIRQLTGKIGEIAMKNMAQQHKNQDFASVLKVDPKSLCSENGQLNGSVNVNGHDQSTEEVVEELYSAEESAIDIVDFSPVYRCLHIFGCLGSREEFENYYRYQRQQQAVLILNSISSANNIFVGDTFRNYLFGIVGFFVIEDHLLNTSNGLVTKHYLANNWDFVIKSLVTNLQAQAALCTDCKQMLYMKSCLMLFCCTTQSYGYSVTPLRQLLVELRQLYTEVLMRQWSLEFKKIFDADNYHPLIVHSQQEFDDHFAGFPFAEMLALEKSKEAATPAKGKEESTTTTATTTTFPKKFPFSSMVPMVYNAVKKFILVSLEFTQDLNLSTSDIEDSARKSTNLLLTRTLSDSLSSLIKKPNLGLLQLIQISINTIYLEEASCYLEKFITDRIRARQTEVAAAVVNSHATTGGGANTAEGNIRLQLKYSSSSTSESASQSHLARLQGKTMFKDARSEAESQIYIQLNKKIDEFFDLANYDYTLADSPGKASSYILDLMAFLKSTFEAFTNLPLKIAQTACLSACKYISMRLLNVLEDDMKAISHGFLQQFNLDLMQCEMFAGSEPVKDFEEGALQSCFVELRQIMDLFVEFDSWSTYFADYGKNESRYLRVQPQMALTLLEKLVKGDNKKNIFSSLSKNERDKKNKIDTILKKLRQLVAASNNVHY